MKHTTNLKLVLLIMVTCVSTVLAQGTKAYYFESAADVNDFIIKGEGPNVGWASTGGVEGTGCIQTDLPDGTGTYQIQYTVPFYPAGYTVIEFDYKDTATGSAINWYLGDAYLQHRSGWGKSPDGGTAGVYRTPLWNDGDWNHMKFVIDNGIVDIYINYNTSASVENYDWSALMGNVALFEMSWSNYVNRVFVDNFTITREFPDSLFVREYDFADPADADDFTFVCQGGTGSPYGWEPSIGLAGTPAILTSLLDGSGLYAIKYDIPFDVVDYTRIEFDVKDLYAGGALLWRFDYGDTSSLAYLKKRSGWEYAADGGTAGVYRNPVWNDQDWNHMKIEVDNGITNIWINYNPSASIENFDWSYSMDDETIFDMGYHNFVHPGVIVDNFRFATTGDGPAQAAPTDCSEAIAQGYDLSADLNDDCYVEWADFGIFASQWQECVDPTDAGCSTPWQ